MLEIGVLALQLLVGGVFHLAAAAKLLHLSEFKAAVQGFGLVPARALQPVSGAIPVLELLCGTLLITGFAVAWSVWLGVSLVVAFIVASSVALAQGRGGIDCYCFGAGRQPLGKATIIKQIVIMALLVPPGTHCRFNLASGGRSHWGRQQRGRSLGARGRGVGGSFRRRRTAAAAHYFPITLRVKHTARE